MSLPRAAAWLFPLLFGLAAGAAGQARVTAIAQGTKAVARTPEVVRVRFAASGREPLAVGDALGVGDLVESASGRAVVELRCADGTAMTLREAFRVVVVAAAHAACSVDLLSGGLGVLTDRPSAVDAGGVRLGSEGTAYGVRAEADGRTRVAVFDGRVRAEEGRVWVVDPGSAVTLAGDGTPRREPLDEQRDVLPTAGAFAAVDLAKGQAAGVPEAGAEGALARLQELEAAVLRAPEDQARRLELARAQLELRNDAGAVYHLGRAGLLSPEELRRLRADPLGRVAPEELERLRGLLLTSDNERTQGLSEAREELKEPERLRSLVHPIEVEQDCTVLWPPSAREYFEIRISSDPAGIVREVAAHEQTGDVTSRHYYYLAKAGVSVSGFRAKSIEYASKALALDRQDRCLTPGERRDCEAIAAQ